MPCYLKVPTCIAVACVFPLIHIHNMTKRTESLSLTASPTAQLDELRSTKFLPLALYSLVEIESHSAPAGLAARLEGDAAPDIGGVDFIHLVTAAEESRIEQPSLKGAPDHHIQYSTAHKDDLTHFLRGFLVLPGDQDSDAELIIV